jgi:3-oxoacyl-[acyl-carrier protein] reductase
LVRRQAGRDPSRPLRERGEIAPTAVLLASDGGAYYTGATLNVSGGDVML